MKWFVEHKLTITIIFLVLFLLLCIGATSQGRSNTTIVEGIISESISPMEKVLYSSSQYIKNFYNFVTNLSSLKKRNEDLEQELMDYRVKLADYDRIVKENSELLELLEFKKENKKFEYISASVISIDPYKNFSLFVIDKGETSEVEKDMIVVLNEGLVGRVLEVSIGTSKVLSITDTTSMFNGKCVRTNDYVRITGDENNTLLGYIDFEADIVEEDIIVTSGYSGVFPKNIVVGEVIEVQEQNGKLEKLIKIKPAVDMEKINKVLIIK